MSRNPIAANMAEDRGSDSLDAHEVVFVHRDDRRAAMTCAVCGAPIRANNRIGICTRNPQCRRARSVRSYADAHPDLAALVPCAVCGQPTRAEYGICYRTEKCQQAMHLARYADPERKKRMAATDAAWKAANPDKVESYRRNRRKRIRDRHIAWRQAEPTFIADWFEAPPEQWDDYMRQWEDANHDHARKLRQQAARFSRSTGEQITLTPALARLELEGREAIYGICGAYLPRPVPWPGGSVIRRSWESHAEGEVFARAVALGHRGGKGVLTLTHDPCSFCAASFAGYARLLGLGSLTVWSASGLFGSCRDGGRFSRPARSRQVSAAR